MIDHINQYIEQLSTEERENIIKIREVILNHLPKGFEERMSYGMLGYVVPHSLYPNGYHVTPELPLPFINLAAQKNHISLYHMGIYADQDLLKWFIDEYKTITNKLPNMGKSCIRFKKTDKIPYELIGKLCEKMTPENWILLYEKQLKK